MIMQEAWGRVGKQGATDTVVFAALLPFSQLWLGVLSAVESPVSAVRLKLVEAH